MNPPRDIVYIGLMFCVARTKRAASEIFHAVSLINKQLNSQLTADSTSTSEYRCHEMLCILDKRQVCIRCSHSEHVQLADV